MEIDRQVEQVTRTMLGHAIRHELDDLSALIETMGNETSAESISLCRVASAYVAIDVCERWPTETDVREIAKNAAESVTRLDISEQEIYRYLSLVALGSETLDDVFSAARVGRVPLFATANLLLTFCPREMDWWEYLDQIWDAAETAERIPLSVLPALMLRGRRESGGDGDAGDAEP